MRVIIRKSPGSFIAGLLDRFAPARPNFGAQTQDTVLGALTKSVFGDLGLYKDRADARLDFRIIDAATGETIYADFGEGSKQRRVFPWTAGSWGSTRDT